MWIKLLFFIVLQNINFLQKPSKLVFKSKNHFVFYNSNNFYLFKYDGEYEGSFYASDEIIVKNPNVLHPTFFENHKFYYSNDKNHKVVSVGGGQFYEVINDTLKRIDYSFNHKMTNGSAVFQKNDTIFKFGGYGFWSSRNFFTYFDVSSKEWEFYPSNSTIVPPPIHDFNYKLIGDDFFIINGYSPNVIDGTKNSKLSEIWRFNFNERKWFNLGVSKLPILLSQ